MLTRGLFLVALLVSACSESDAGDRQDAGSGGVTASGGATGSGGSHSGGTAGTGGVSSTGGAKATGGSHSGGASATAGAHSGGTSASGGAVASGGDPGDAASASPECVTFCSCMAQNCADKTFPDGCLVECAAQSQWNLECRQIMCTLVPAEPNNNHCTHAMGVNECLDKP